MKPQKAVISETLHIAAGTAALSAVMLIVYAIVGKMSLNTMLGALYGSVLVILNFFALGMTVQMSAKGIQEDDEQAKQHAKAQMQFSYSVRMLAVFGMEVLGIAVLKLDALACLLPLVFPRITIAVMNIRNTQTNRESVK